MLKTKLAKLGFFVLVLGALVATRPSAAVPVCCSDCDTLFETCITNFPNNVHACTLGHDHCLQICIPGC